jgi:hypothetical protein
MNSWLRNYEEEKHCISEKSKKQGKRTELINAHKVIFQAFNGDPIRMTGPANLIDKDYGNPSSSKDVLVTHKIAYLESKLSL